MDHIHSDGRHWGFRVAQNCYRYEFDFVACVHCEGREKKRKEEKRCAFSQWPIEDDVRVEVSSVCCVRGTEDRP